MPLTTDAPLQTNPNTIVNDFMKDFASFLEVSIKTKWESLQLFKKMLERDPNSTLARQQVDTLTQDLQVTIKQLLELRKDSEFMMSDTKQIISSEGFCPDCGEVKLEADKNNNVKQWITVNGVHIPIKKGQNKDDVVDDFIAKQKDKEPTKKDKPKEPPTFLSTKPPKTKDVIIHPNANKLENELLNNTSDRDKKSPPVIVFKDGKENSSFLATNGDFIRDPNLSNHISYVDKHGKGVGADFKGDSEQRLAQFEMQTGFIRTTNNGKDVGFSIKGNPSRSQLNTIRSFDSVDAPITWDIRGKKDSWLDVALGGQSGEGFKDLAKALRDTGQIKGESFNEFFCPDCGESKIESFSINEKLLNEQLIAFTHSSSWIGNVRYNTESKTMRILMNGEAYTHCGVERIDYDAFEGAPSKGEHWWRNIKDQFNC